MTVTESLAYIADLQAHPGMIANPRKLRQAAAVLSLEVERLAFIREGLLTEITRLRGLS